METHPLISVIIPVHNVEDYLHEAVESVLKQTYLKWEMILVDDGSTDRSGYLCDQYASIDSRISVLHTKNGGLAHARNVGLGHAQGEWVLFLDSDDVWNARTIETALSYAEGVDVVCFGLMEFPERRPMHWVEKVVTYPDFFSMQEKIATIYSMDGIRSACTKLYRRAVIQVRFDDSLRHIEDLIFNMMHLPKCRGIRLIPNMLYNYRREERSTLSTRFWMDSFEISKRVLFLALETFAKSPEASAFFARRFMYESIKQFTILCSFEHLSSLKKRLILQMYLDDDVLDFPLLHETACPEALSSIWGFVLKKDADALLNECTEKGWLALQKTRIL